MVWFKVDDGFINSHKVLSIPKGRRLAAVGLWTLMGAWSAGQLTDGEVPFYVLDTIPGAKTYVSDLIKANLLTTSEQHYVFHDWSDYQPAKAEVLADRAAAAARQKSRRDRMRAERNAASHGVSHGVSHGGSHGTPSQPGPAQPSPARPDPTVVPTELPRKERTRARARTPKPRESTGTRRVRDAAEALDEILHDRENGQPPQIGTG